MTNFSATVVDPGRRGENVARPLARWVRGQLACGHGTPVAGAPVEPAIWENAGEPIREWTLAFDRERTETIESEVREWALGRGIYTTENLRTLLAAPCTMLASAVLPGAGDRVIRLLSMYWTLIIAFDDQVIEAGQPPEKHRDTVANILRSGKLPLSPDGFQLAFWDVRSGLLDLGDEALLDVFTDAVLTAMETYVQEWRHRQAGTMPSSAEYLRDAVGNSHIIPGMLLQRRQPGLVPPALPLPPDLGELARLVTIVARLENDLLSFHKDARDGAANICWILAAELGLHPTDAIPCVVAMITALRTRHDDLLATILADRSRSDVHRQARAISTWIDACYAWFLTVARYGA